ncbi:winged helix domain-containing protein [Kaistia terrae]|uniref:Winged helix domain-containing protein n=1 Tax=Kaistia terrae TaxID=537017 RepID=A0ABW0PWW2_9HYPH|nr:hypothetical protein [Kaistia terrae]MCX5580531.1 hypothetical protein [Kaistia terrae]
MSNVTKLEIRVGGHDGRILVLKGRVAWMVDRLIKAGPRGTTSIESPAPRISHYVFKAREAGLNIETVDEPHDGAFSGRHGRYFLRSTVEVLSLEVAA